MCMKGISMEEIDKFKDSGEFLKAAGFIPGEYDTATDGLDGFGDSDVFEDDDDAFLDGPREGTPLYAVLNENGILAVEARGCYEHYDRSNRGCSEDDPIVIGEIEGYVDLEYQVLEHLLRGPHRFVDYELEKQSLVGRGTRRLDVLTVKVYTHPIISMDGYGNITRPEREFLGTEEYWFDITAGFNAIADRHH